MSQLEAHKYWINTKLRLKRPDLVLQCTAVLKSFDYIEAVGKLEKTKFNRIVLAAGSLDTWLSQVGTLLLGKLAIKYIEARKTINDFSLSKQARVRFNALVCLNRKLPKKLILPIVAKGLGDKSAHVRRLAAFKAQELNLVELIPSLEKQCAFEKHQNTKTEIEFHLALLRDGYSLKALEDEESFDLWVPVSDGFAGRTVTKTEIDQKGIQSLIHELKHD